MSIHSLPRILATIHEILGTTNHNTSSAVQCIHQAASTLERAADSYAAKKSWDAARKTFSQTLEIVKLLRSLLLVEGQQQKKKERAAHNEETRTSGPRQDEHSPTTRTSCPHAAAGSAPDDSSSLARSQSSPTTTNIVYSSSATFEVLHNTANACLNLKQYGSALKAQKQCLGIISTPTTATSIEGSLVTSDARIGIILSNMAHIYFAKGDMWVHLSST